MSDGPAGDADGRASASQTGPEQAAQAEMTPEPPAAVTGAGASQPGPAQPDQGHEIGEGENESVLKETLGLVARAACWALLIYLFIFQVSVVDGTSMMPNFEHHERLVIDKLTYVFSGVRRFDVIVFEAVDADRSLYTPRDYIKRVMGLPGETVEIRDGKVRIIQADGTGFELEQTFRAMPFTSYRENGQPGVRFVVPPEHYFVMGDNRGDSKDSRRDTIGRTLGFVPARQIKGLVRIRLDWPWERLAWLPRGK